MVFTKVKGFKDYLKPFFEFKFFILLLLGFSSGLPLALTSTTLQTWYAVYGINIVAIGFLSLVGQPYIFKFLWAPLMDRYMPPLLGKRRGWILICQLGLILIFVLMAFLNPGQYPFTLAWVAFVAVFLSASQDINVDAYRTDLLSTSERGFGSATAVAGYRIAMLVSGGIALILAELWGWRGCYLFMAALMLIGVFATYYAPPLPKNEPLPTNLYSAFVEPLHEFLSRPYALGILLFIILYKISFELTFILTPTFLYRALHFSLLDIGTINKGLGLTATLLGVFVGGILLVRMNIVTALFIFGFFHALSNLGYMALALAGKNFLLMVIAVCAENLFAGMETAAFISLLMSLCDHRYTATQFALLSALAVSSRIFVGPVAGVVVEHIGWTYFYFCSFIVAIPGLLLLILLKNTLNSNGGSYSKKKALDLVAT